MRLILALAVALSASSPVFAAEPTPNGPATIDVVVEDGRGRTVETLNAADFSVTEQSRPLALESVRFIRAGARTAGVSPVPVSAALKDSNQPATSVVAIYLDEFHVTPGPSVERIRRALIRFVNEDLDPSDQLIVLKSLDSLLDITPVTDRAEAIRKVES